jgi:hypothetical protein
MHADCLPGQSGYPVDDHLFAYMEGPGDGSDPGRAVDMGEDLAVIDMPFHTVI